MTESPVDPKQHPITGEERSGILHPERLERYAAGWITPSFEVSDVVDQYWHVSWNVPNDEPLDQRIIDLPAVTVTIEAGNVPAPLVVTGVQTGAWRRTISGTGGVFAIRLRPAGLAVLSDLTPADVADTTLRLTPALDHRLHALVSAIATETSPLARARAANHAIRQLMKERAPTESGLLANVVLEELRERVPHRTGRVLASRFHRSERAIQRAFVETLGHGPKWVSRRIRLQEVALALATRPADDIAAIAADLGYADQSHLTSEFRAVSGVTPAVYRRNVQRLQAE